MASQEIALWVEQSSIFILLTNLKPFSFFHQEKACEKEQECVRDRTVENKITE